MPLDISDLESSAPPKSIPLFVELSSLPSSISLPSVVDTGDVKTSAPHCAYQGDWKVWFGPRSSHPAPRGTGLVSSPAGKRLLSMAGIEDCYTSTRGHTHAVTSSRHFSMLFRNTYGYLEPDLWKENVLTAPFSEGTLTSSQEADKVSVAFDAEW
eukprot:g9088.t1 g9088   contig34:817790-818254(+)